MSVYLGVLFIASAIAIGSIWASWMRYWPTARTLRQQIAICPLRQELRFTIINLEVERGSAVIHRPVFTPTQQASRPQVAQRAA